MTTNNAGKSIVIEYEVRPMRAIMTAEFADDGQTNDDVMEAVRYMHPNWLVRKIRRRDDGLEDTIE